MRKEWAEDANTIAAQGWLPIKFPGRTKTTTVLGLVSLCGITTRPFAMTHEAYSTPQPLQMQATMQYARKTICQANRQREQKAGGEKKVEWRASCRNPVLFSHEPEARLDRSPEIDPQPSPRAVRRKMFR